MSHFETLMARDGHAFRAYIARPDGHVRGGVVVLQEIFGLTDHIRQVADGFAADGYLAVAPALYDRVRRDLVLEEKPGEIERALGYRKQIETSKSVLDIAASAAMARHCGKIAVIGYCWGGTLAWIAAADVPFAAAVCYYGGGIADHLDKLPGCPTMLHFGEQDQSIPPATVERIRFAFPQGLYFTYAAGHAFNNDHRPDRYNAEAAALARSHTLAFLGQQVG